MKNEWRDIKDDFAAMWEDARRDFGFWLLVFLAISPFLCPGISPFFREPTIKNIQTESTPVCHGA